MSWPDKLIYILAVFILVCFSLFMLMLLIMTISDIVRDRRR